ncbi:MAG: NADH-quinone oxidoreductase subunit A [Bacteriovoracaceae bacterium]
MIPAQFDGLMPIVILMGLAVLLFVGGHFASVLLSPKKPSHLKSTPYECGEQPIGSAWAMFNVRFYVVGLIFIIFDVESVLMFPVAAIFKQLNEAGEGVYALVIFLSFISVLIEGIAYCWRKGDLDWVKSFQISNKK